MRSNALLTVCSSVIFATNTLLWMVDRPSPTLASAPGATRLNIHDTTILPIFDCICLFV